MITRNFPAAIISLLLAFCQSAQCVIIGTNVPAEPLTEMLVAVLPPSQQPAWRNYLARSVRQMQMDRDFFRAEMRAHGVKRPTAAPSSHNAREISLTESDAWYAGAEARRISEIIVSFQTPAGGWSKNLNFARHIRAPGESFGTDNNSKFERNNDFDTPPDPAWHYIGTYDNDATITQLRFLAKVISNSHQTNTACRESFRRGMEYVFNSQYPSGGWPQVWPLEGGYHDAITFNDDAMLHILELLQDVSHGLGEFAFVPVEIRTRSAASFKQGMDCLLAAQIRVNGTLTVWCQQHDPITLKPASARNFEMPAKTSSESAEIVLFLMRLPDPSQQIIASVHAAAEWFQKVPIRGKTYKSNGLTGRHLIAADESNLIWARYYDISTDRPIFGDRDKTIHDTVEELSRERRDGYGWYRDTPKRLLQHYARWSAEHPR